MVRYRIDVGRDHGVQVKDIVGAIANEAGIESRFIGRIALYDESSTVELPAGMPEGSRQRPESAPASAACRSICVRTKAMHARKASASLTASVNSRSASKD
jgi:hypothetical protein